jgi:ABC-type transport system involved in multi-copper enzyme maturation permease subunit
VKWLPRRLSLVGPLGAWELIRLARRGQPARARLMVLYLLFLAFVLTPILWFPHVDPVELFLGSGQELPHEEVATFANRFALVVLHTILIAVIAMTPAYAAAAVSEEKDRQTLTLLLTTPLSDREIVFGKAFGRVTFVLAGAAAGLPVMFAIRFYGGVDIQLLLTGGALIASAAVFTAAVGIHAACATRDLRTALIQAYLITASFFIVTVVLLPVLMLGTPVTDEPWIGLSAGLGFSAIQAVIAVWLLVSASKNLRREENLREPSRSRPVAESESPDNNDADNPIDADILEVEPVLEIPRRWWDPPRVSSFTGERQRLWRPPIHDDDPVGWKERYVSSRRGEPGLQAIGVLFGVLAVLLMLIGVGKLIARLLPDQSTEGEIRIAWQPDDWAGYLLMIGGTVAAGLYLIPVAVGLAGVIAKERHKRTLESLLTVPLSRREILWRKVRVILRCNLAWGILAVSATGLAFFADKTWPVGLAAAVFTFGNACLAIGLGAWLTVRCVTEMRALRLLIPVTVLAIGAPVGLRNGIDWFRPQALMTWLLLVGIVSGLAGMLLWRRACQGMEHLE